MQVWWVSIVKVDRGISDGYHFVLNAITIRVVLGISNQVRCGKRGSFHVLKHIFELFRLFDVLFFSRYFNSEIR